VTSARQASPRGAVTVIHDKEGIEASWAGTADAMMRISGRAQDMRGLAKHGTAIEMRYRVDRVPEREVSLGVRCTEPRCGNAGGAMLDLTPSFRHATIGAWNSLVVPLSCLAAAGADLSNVEVPFAIATAGRFEVTIAEIRLNDKAVGSAAVCPAAASR
jgi:beta-glucosidase